MSETRATKQKSVINRAELKRYVLHMTELLRPGWDCRQVSASALDELEAIFKNRVRDCVRRHPTIGKTFKEVQ
jgi:hypothetical protein